MRLRMLALAALLVACEGRSVVGGPQDAGPAAPDRPDTGPADVATQDALDAPAMDAPAMDAPAIDTPAVDAPAVDAPDAAVPVDVPPACRSDDDCRTHELGLLACDTMRGQCVLCTATNQSACGPTEYCDTSVPRCATGCRDDSSCASMSGTNRCDTTARRCVACVVDAHCPPGSLCMGNQCVAGCSESQPCPTGQSCCAGGCVNPQTNTAHCGGCGMACMLANASAVCAMGRCAVDRCTPGFGDCDGSATNGCETDTRTTVAHCGGCGMACAARPNATAACAMGTCAYTCAAGFADCNADPMDGCEVDTRTTLAHCGGCGMVCATRPNATASCTAGACTYRCDTGFADCDNDPSNGCEVNTQTASAHCGACGNACTTGMNCSNGTCGNICQAPTTFCAGGCVNTTTDVAHCGGCGVQCPARPNASARCTGGACGLLCDTGFGDCDGNTSNGCETDIRTTVAHCGGCGMLCAVRPNTVASCAGGTCSYACAMGFADCDGNTSNGCEVDTRTSTAHCGGCGRACQLANATNVCVAGACGIGSCNAGFGNCDGVVGNGCEANTGINTQHCGRCNNACPSGAVCAAGACACPPGFATCAGACTNVSADPANCGACGRMCPSSQVCVAGACVPTCSPGSTLCNGACVILGSDPRNCGRCGNVCPAEHSCSGGVCTPILNTSEIGCADGQREAFVDRGAFPNIAACSGGWSRQGIFPSPLRSNDPACARSGDDGNNPNGTGCSSVDLCAPGWHLCRGGEIRPRAPQGCAATTFPADTFYAAAVSGTGCGVCALLTGTVTSGCTSANCITSCREDPSLNNDFFGCGSTGAAIAPAGCDGLDRFSNNDCGSLGAPWVCGGSVLESITVTKTTGARGGVLCCR
jgi:hypothetical protein